LLVIAAGAGTWNYRRNAALEEGEYRPYRGYSTGDLDALIAATEQELGRAQRDYQRGSGQPVRVQEHGFFGDSIREFERVQRLSQNSRELGGRVLERDGALERLRAERARRDPGEGPVLRFLKLAFVYRG
jgi:hypothetical protein